MRFFVLRGSSAVNRILVPMGALAVVLLKLFLLPEFLPPARSLGDGYRTHFLELGDLMAKHLEI